LGGKRKLMRMGNRATPKGCRLIGINVSEGIRGSGKFVQPA